MIISMFGFVFYVAHLVFELYPYGDIQNFINDFESWQSISPYLILVCDNFKDFIFIDDEKKMIQSQNT